MTTTRDASSLQLISGDKVKELFDSLYTDILTKPFTSESAFVTELWGRYPQGTPSLNGAVFEGILAAIFYRSNILPLFIQAKLSFVPNVDFDFVAYSEEYGPVILSAKTSLRERYKQADLEGMMLRQVHRKAKSYLLTLNKQEAKSVNNKIDDGRVLGLDKVIVATQPEFDQLILELKQLSYCKPEKIDVLTSTRLVI